MTKTAWSIREGALDDAEPLQRLVAGVIAERLPVVIRRERAFTIEEEFDFVRRLIEAPNSILFVAELGGDIVGSLDFHGDPKSQFAHGGEFGMSVKREYRGQGIGRALIEALFAWVERERRVSRIGLQVFANNPKAIRLYESCGFEHEGRKHKAVEVDGELIDVILMAKLFT